MAKYLDEKGVEILIGIIDQKVDGIVIPKEYDDTEIKARITILEGKKDNDTIYDDSALLARITALEEKIKELSKDLGLYPLSGSFYAGANSNELYIYVNGEKITFNNVDFEIEAKKLASVKFNDFSMFSNKIERVEKLPPFDDKLKSLTGMFGDCSFLQYVNTEDWVLKNITDLDYMFSHCTKLSSIDVRNWNVENVANMSGMFTNCQNLYNIDLSKWNLSNVEDMSYMFNDCSNLYDLTIGDDYYSSRNFSKVTKMNSMFKNCSNLCSLNLNGSCRNVKDMNDIFKGCKNLGNFIAKDISCSLDISETKISGNEIYYSLTYTTDGILTLSEAQYNELNEYGYASMLTYYGWTLNYNEVPVEFPEGFKPLSEAVERETLISDIYVDFDLVKNASSSYKWVHIGETPDSDIQDDYNCFSVTYDGEVWINGMEDTIGGRYGSGILQDGNAYIYTFNPPVYFLDAQRGVPVKKIGFR